MERRPHRKIEGFPCNKCKKKLTKENFTKVCSQFKNWIRGNTKEITLEDFTARSLRNELHPVDMNCIVSKFCYLRIMKGLILYDNQFYFNKARKSKDIDWQWGIISQYHNEKISKIFDAESTRKLARKNGLI